MYVNGSLPSLNNSNNSTVELGVDLRALTTSQLQQTGDLMGSNSNLNKLTIGLNSNSVAPLCKLCGNAASAMKCAECMGMQFCYACDNCYHRHPKRKNHVRKSINLLNTTTASYFANDDSNALRSSSSSINNLLNQQIMMQQNDLKNVQTKQIRGLEHPVHRSISTAVGANCLMYQSSNNYNAISNFTGSKIEQTHPTNMGPIGLPIPPPRKRALKIQNARKVQPGIEQLNNELKAKLIMSSNPMSSSCGNLVQVNQLNRHPQMQYKMNQQVNMQNVNNPMNRRQSIDSWQTSSKGYVSMSPQPPYMNNVQNMQQLQNNQILQNGFIKNQQKQLLNPYMQRRNLSLTDINSANLQLLANNSYLPYAIPFNFDLNSLSQSMDDMLVDDESFSDDNCSSNSSRKHRQSNKKQHNNKQVKRSSSRGSSVNNKNLTNEKLIRRSHSSAHLMNPLKLSPYEYVQQNLLTNLYYAQPLLNQASISPASSIRSLEPYANGEPIKRKNSVSSMLSNRTLVNGTDCNELNSPYKNSQKSSSRYRRSREQSSLQTRRSKSLCRSKSQTSNRSSKSYRSTYDKSNRCISSDSEDEMNEEESEYSSCSADSYSNRSNLDESTQSELEDHRKKFNRKQWKCKWCTFVNRNQMNICEMCSKSNPQMLNNRQERTTNAHSNKANKSLKNRNESKQLTGKSKEHETNSKNANKSDLVSSNYIEFTDELIKQQEEVEKELLRRIANERLVEEENSKIEQVNDKSRTSMNKTKESLDTKVETVEKTNDSTRSNENFSSHATSTEFHSLNESNATTNSTQNRNIVSKIKPPSISLKQQFPNQLNNGSTSKVGSKKLTKTQSLDSNGKNSTAINEQSGRQREEKFATKQFGFGKSANVQQFTSQQYDQRCSRKDRSEEPAKSEPNIILNSCSTQETDSYDKKVLDGMQMFKLLREAEKRDFLAEELEIALTFNSNDPIRWLDDNWSSMKETVLTLANNQLVTICQEKNASLMSTVNEEDARSALRYSKGNIWQAIDRCVNLKKGELKENMIQSKIPVYTPDKHDVKSFTFNLKSLGQGSSNRDGNENKAISLRQEKVLSKSQLNLMENLLNDWYEMNLKTQNKNESPNQPNTSEKVRNLITFLKQNGYFDTNKLSQNEIDNQMKTLMNLLEKKLKETQENNQTNESDKMKNNLIDLNNSNNSSNLNISINSIRSSASNNSSKSNASSKSKDSNKSKNSTHSTHSSKIDQEFEEIDEKMKQSLTFLEQIEQQTNQQQVSEESMNSEKKRLNYKNLRITSRVSIDDEFEDATDLLNEPIHEPIHNVSIKLENSPSIVEATANIKKEKGKIKIIKRKIYRNSSSEQKSFEKIAYVNSIEEADLINLDDEINLEEMKNGQSNEDKESKETNTTFNFVNDRTYDENKMNLNQGNQLLIDDDVEKRLNQLNPNFGYARTIYECGICCNKHHINELISMLFCEHRACKNCLEKYYTVQIREKQRVLIKCPFCDQPEIQSDDENSIHEYLTLLQELVKNIVSKDLYELFQRKIRDRTLQKEPGFRWCVNCCSGFLHGNIDGNVLRCPDCKSLSCSKCGELWQDEHRVLNCEQFKQFLSGGSEWMDEHKLTIHLNEFGIICPKCKFRYELSKGGCLHFKCVQCEHEFCYGCDASFRAGDKCSLYGKSCEKLGFHAHHPRNCLFYLRDKKSEDLEKLLKSNKIDYEIKDFDSTKTECEIMEQKEVDSGLKDEPCQRPIEKYGICNLHYIEHLAKLVKRNHIDPITIFDESELISVLKREQIDVPKKSDFKTNYKSKLIETIELHSPLI